MSYKALYRTYRPLKFSEVAGQKAIVRTLQNALSQNKMAHAYLFSGPRGTGKTSMAKLFAKALNCDEGVGHECNKCINCLGVIDGSHPDVYEIDAASNNGVEDVRQLIENINYAPIRGRYKVYIIDEVHMMTQSAFNALLKTLEEPPQNVIFILATTEPHKVIPTILSRCQRYNFAKVSDKDISDRLTVILNTEKVVYEEEALNLLVSLADGGVRDALSMLDQVLAYAEQRLQLNDVLALFALTSKLEQINLLHAIATSDVEKVFNIVGGLLDKGVDVRRLTSDLLNLLKDALIFARTENSELMHILRQNEAETVVNMFNLQTLNMVIENLLKAQADYRFASDIKNIFEITLLKIINEIGLQALTPAQTSTPVSVQKAPTPKAPLPEKKEEKPMQQPALQDEVPPFMAPTPKPEPKRVVTETKPKPQPETVVPPKPVVKKPSNEKLHKDGTDILLTDDALIKILTLADRDEKMKLRNERWDDLELLAMDADFGDHAALLFDGQPYALANEIIIMEFNFGRNAKYINLKENQKVIQDVMSTLLGRRIPVYGLTHEQAVMLTRKYRSMSQVNKLPKVKSVSDELEGKF